MDIGTLVNLIIIIICLAVSWRIANGAWGFRMGSWEKPKNKSPKGRK